MSRDIFSMPSSGDIDQMRQELVEQKKHEYHLVGQMQKRPGHILFSFNTVTKEIKPAEIERCTIFDMGKMGPAHNNKVHKEKDCIYLYALNKKNCIKHLERLGIQIKQ